MTMSTPPRLNSSAEYSSAPGYSVRSRSQATISPRGSASMRDDIHRELPRRTRSGGQHSGRIVGMRTVRQGVDLVISDEDTKKMSKYLKSAA
ncbi:hypothetical protein [Nocardia terpenica]|uniref:Uncharacterized protein n=1 Tax=Nocardia terpenica TaxID=455432 RepID=A0A6G9YZ54_9NOCA|nr:hypothetical protein [Nocardia terpenica]QIS18266.1 hypothetical protein F6W96_08220 [Nocardia terpenica]